ncbi:unnamed protein product [Cyprideis torosa]|uniref:Uncharacterized protein n=1 Tax=Cyprideis torosa TaxID=163714 RepID=A0A7R8WB08_9CRUS|nr:unnamed protein product [Cyprideis torosa]CAG0890300.1 unnamed protein product [Cyprideis torosa]
MSWIAGTLAVLLLICCQSRASFGDSVQNQILEASSDLRTAHAEFSHWLSSREGVANTEVGVLLSKLNPLLEGGARELLKRAAAASAKKPKPAAGGVKEGGAKEGAEKAKEAKENRGDQDQVGQFIREIKDQRNRFLESALQLSNDIHAEKPKLDERAKKSESEAIGTLMKQIKEQRNKFVDAALQLTNDVNARPLLEKVSEVNKNIHNLLRTVDNVLLKSLQSRAQEDKDDSFFGSLLSGFQDAPPMEDGAPPLPEEPPKRRLPTWVIWMLIFCMTIFMILMGVLIYCLIAMGYCDACFNLRTPIVTGAPGGGHHHHHSHSSGGEKKKKKKKKSKQKSGSSSTTSTKKSKKKSGSNVAKSKTSAVSKTGGPRHGGMDSLNPAQSTPTVTEYVFDCRSIFENGIFPRRG